MPVAYFEMRVGRWPASHRARSAGEGVAGFFVSTTAISATATGSPSLMAAVRWAGRRACGALAPAAVVLVRTPGVRRRQVRAVSMVARASARGRCRVVRS